MRLSPVPVGGVGMESLMMAPVRLVRAGVGLTWAAKCMSTRKSSIGARLTLDKREFKEALEKARQDAGAFKAGMEQMKISKGALVGEGFSVGKWTELNSKINVIGGGLKMVGASAVAMGKSLFQAEADFESLVRGLSATVLEKGQLENEIEGLKEVAKLPGLGFKEAMQGAIALKGVSMSAREAKDTMMAFGNALANVGKGKTELDAILVSIQQMISTRQVDLENLKEISGRLPGFLEIAERLPKDDARQWLRLVVTELEKIPKAAESAKDKLDNMKDAAEMAKLGISGGVVTSIGGGVMDAMGRVLQGKDIDFKKITDGTPWKKIGEAQFDKVKGAITGKPNEEKLKQLEKEIGLISKYEPSEEELARRKKVKDDLAKAQEEQKRLAEQKVKDDEAAAKKAQLAATKPQRDEAQASLEVLRLRAAGKNRQADEMQQKQAEAARIKQLEAAGMSPAQAAAMASEETALNKAIASGRRKTYKGAADVGLSGLAAFDAMQERMDRRSLNEEWSFGGLDAYRDLQSKNRPKKEASAAAGSRANATAGDPSTAVIAGKLDKVIQGLDHVASRIDAKAKFFE